MRIAIGGLVQQSDTSVPCLTTMDSFKRNYLRRDTELLDDAERGLPEIGGFLGALASAGATPVPLLAGDGGSGGSVMRETFHVLVTEMVHRLAARLPVDGVLLALHGAMAVEDEPDAEAEILERARNVLPPGTPIGVSLHPHAHVTPRMLQLGVFLLGSRGCAAADRVEAGERTAGLLLDVVHGRRRPVMALARRVGLVARGGAPSLGRIAAEARRMEEDGSVLHASLFTVQPRIDVPDLGFAALVCADRDPGSGAQQAAQGAAQVAADRLADMAWAMRAAFDPRAGGGGDPDRPGQ